MSTMNSDTKKTGRKIILRVAPFISIGILIALWFIASGDGSGIIASPQEVVEKIGELTVTPLGGYTLFEHVWASLQRVLIALACAMVIGIPMGILIGWNKFFAKTVGTIFELIRPIPALAWIPLLVAWFGVGEVGRVVLVFLAAMQPIVVNSYTAIRLIDPLYLDVGRMFNANTHSQILSSVVLPAAVPTIFAGIRNATSLSWMVVLAAEMIGAQSGLGFLIIRGTETFDVSLLLSSMIIIGVVGALLSVITNLIEKRVCPWNTAKKSN